MPEFTPAAALSAAIAAAGTAAELARRLHISREAVAQWTQVPADRALAVEEATGVSRYDLRPDIYGPKPPTVAEPPATKDAAA